MATMTLRTALAYAKGTALAARELIANPRTPWWKRVLLVVGVAYLASPIDLIPDFIPVVGWADDAVVVVLLLKLIRSEAR